ncbi:MAG: hypothetical protein CMM52_01490 [Rhodospirillaceae bacterium]|nr:hypothetical protein [Rhodospirillaceae bacterium]|tara:strand:- start:9906 stop:10448 length:543 start_codon:yes stop_codon:yes gene_type:complete
MKNLTSISVVALVAAGALWFTTREEPKTDAAVYESLQQCLADVNMVRSDCEKNYAAAKQQHASVAPKFATQRECEEEFGAARCEKAPQTTSTGSSMFMPLMMGYMMGSVIGGRGYGNGQPLYRTRANPGTFRTADNKSAGRTVGRTKVAKSSTTRPTAKSSTRSRGGFGSLGRRFGSAAT